MTRPTPDPLAVTGQRPYRSRHGIVRWSGPRPVDAPPTLRICGDCQREVVALAKWRTLSDSERIQLAGTHAPAGQYAKCADCTPDAKCGTDSGYYHHRRGTKTKPCKPCREAHNVANKLANARRRIARAAEERAANAEAAA